MHIAYTYLIFIASFCCRLEEIRILSKKFSYFFKSHNMRRENISQCLTFFGGTVLNISLLFLNTMYLYVRPVGAPTNYR